MPTGLAVVTARSPRRARRLQRRRTRVLVGLLAALVATLAPVESPVPLGPLEGLAGSAPAEAQTAITDGTPDPCPAGLQPDPGDESLCVLSQPACPEHPLQPGSYLVLSTEFPDFCEETVVDPAMYTNCTNLTGYVIKADGVSCRMIRPTQCAQNMHRTGTNTCKRVQRRTWRCMSGTPTNRFNKCYHEPAGYVGRHPACVTGAPSFAISSCEDYVSLDFERAPASVPCNSFDTGGSPRLTNASNSYWCQFDPSYLDVDCYGASPPCATATAVCVKRASTTGGCSAIADALRCRDLQADYRDRSVTGVTAEDVYLEGCTPCVVLPFSPTPPDCPRDLLTDPSRSSESRLEDTHQRRSDTGPGGSSACTDPPRGRLVWESSHHVGLAIVNSPVILRVIDVPSTARRYQFVGLSINHVTRRARFGPLARHYFEYADSTPIDPVVRAWSAFDPSVAYSDVNQIVGDGSCLVRLRPDFRVRIEELWPDSDASDIEALFGRDALNWWTDLNPTGTDPTLQRRRTEARGLNYVGDMNAMDRAAELASRAADLTQVVRCNYGADVWCNWRPTKPGYYRLVAAGAWYMSKFGSRSWYQAAYRTAVDNTLADMLAASDSVCTRTPGHWSHQDIECLAQDLSNANLTPADAGLKSDLSGLLPAGSSAEWLYTDAAGPYVLCLARDLRVSCAGGRESSNYTESEPIGILVHEVRVSTVTPDG